MIDGFSLTYSPSFVITPTKLVKGSGNLIGQVLSLIDILPILKMSKEIKRDPVFFSGSLFTI
jgi:hypothetical protein